MISARRSCHNGRRRCWAPAGRRHAGQNPVCHPARSSCCCSQFRLQTSQELLSRLRRAAGYFPGLPCYETFVSLQTTVFVPLVVFLLSHPGTRTGLYYIDSTALATIIALADTRFLPVWPNGARWAGSSASNCTLSSTTTMRSSP